MTETDDRLNEHSKRLAKLETDNIYLNNTLTQVLARMNRVWEVLIGSDDPKEISIKDQLRANTVLLQGMASDFREFKDEHISDQKDQIKRTDELERWRKDEADPHLTASKETKQERRKRWMDFGMQALFWLITFILGMIASYYILGVK